MVEQQAFLIVMPGFAEYLPAVKGSLRNAEIGITHEAAIAPSRNFARALHGSAMAADRGLSQQWFNYMEQAASRGQNLTLLCLEGNNTIATAADLAARINSKLQTPSAAIKTCIHRIGEAESMLRDCRALVELNKNGHFPLPTKIIKFLKDLAAQRSASASIHASSSGLSHEDYLQGILSKKPLPDTIFALATMSGSLAEFVRQLKERAVDVDATVLKRISADNNLVSYTRNHKDPVKTMAAINAFAEILLPEDCCQAFIDYHTEKYNAAPEVTSLISDGRINRSIQTRSGFSDKERVRDTSIKLPPNSINTWKPQARSKKRRIGENYLIMKTFYVMRHAKSFDNENNIVSGGQSDCDLSPSGVVEAQGARRIFNLLGHDVKVVTSGLRRTHQTAFNVTGSDDYKQEPRLNERGLGSADGTMTVQDYEAGAETPSAEHKDQHMRRVVSGVNERLVSDDPAAFMICHGGTIRRIFEAAGFQEKIAVKNAQIFQFVPLGTTWQVFELSEKENKLQKTDVTPGRPGIEKK